ncbi:hypothetical protein C8J57DRAFT_1021980, partial [Mycena rebaudengoi]
HLSSSPVGRFTDMMRLALSSLFFLLLLVTSRAANDWSKPCFDGECWYDLPESSVVSGSLRIWGSSDAISDITPVAGFTILDCDKSAMAQDVRLVCHDASGCPHLVQSIGAVGKLVRLPESCGASSFARITKDWVHKDQTLPVELARRLYRRDGVLPEVIGLSIDTDFSATKVPPAGPVSFVLHGLTTSVPDIPKPQRRSRLAEPSLNERSVISVLQQAFQEFNSFNQASKKLPEVNLKKSFNLVDEKVSCPASGVLPPFDAAVTVDVEASMVLNITLAISAVGTMIPTNFTKFGVVVGLDANLEGTLDMKSSASVSAATIDSGRIDLFSVGIPGLSFPGILEIGPTFKIQAQATAALDINVDLKVDLSWCISGAKLFYPPTPFHTPSGKFTPNNSPLNLSVSSELASKANLAAHVIPRLEFGLNALDKFAEATVFVDFDTSSTLTLSLDALANATGSVDTATGTGGKASADASIDGCVDIGVGLSIDAGAEGEFFGLLDAAPQVNLF